MSKAARIRARYAKGQSTREIADAIGCPISYVRVVARQRTATGGDSPYDKAWKSSAAYKKFRRDRARFRYHTDGPYRRRALATARRYRARQQQEGASA